jgi:hypothetical protein
LKNILKGKENKFILRTERGVAMKSLQKKVDKKIKFSRFENLRRYSNLPDELSLLRQDSPFSEDNGKGFGVDCPVCGISEEEFSELVKRMENFLMK